MGSIIRRVRPLTTSRAILYGGLTVGALDLIDAFVFFGLRSGARPMGILHSIAAGFLGRDAARAGGVSTAIVGFFSHFLVAFCIVTVYVLMSRVIPALRKQWVRVRDRVRRGRLLRDDVVRRADVECGKPARSRYALPATPIMINGILIHVFGVGLPAAYFASVAWRRLILADAYS